MNDINIIQYLPLTHPRATLRLVKSLSAAGVMTILDLEDSAQDPFSKKLPKILKLMHEITFLRLLVVITGTQDPLVFLYILE